MARYPDGERGRPGGGRRRRGRLGAGPAPGPAGLEGRHLRGGAVLASRRGLGLRRGRQPSPLLDRKADHRRRRPDRDGQEQLRPRGWRLHGPLRRLLPPLSPERPRDPHPRRGRRRLAHHLRGPPGPLRTGGSRAARRRPALAVGRPPQLPHLAPPDLRLGHALWEGARQVASRCGSARSASPTARSATGPTASTAATACRAARSTPRPARMSPTCPMPSAHGVEIRANCMATRVEIDRSTGRATGVAYFKDGEQVERIVSGAGGRRRRLLHRDAAPAAQLDLGPIPQRRGQQRGPGRPLRHGPGRGPVRRAVSRRAAHVQGAAARSVLRGLLRDRPGAGLRPRLLHPDRLARCPSGGPSTCWPKATGAGRCASTCATTTTGPSSASSTSCCPSPTTGSPWPRRRTAAGCRSPGSTTACATTTKPTSTTRPGSSAKSSKPAGAQDVLTIHRYAHLIGGRPHGHLAGQQRRRRQPAGLGRPQPLPRRRQRLPDPGLGQPGAHHHGPRLPPGRAPRQRDPPCRLNRPRPSWSLEPPRGSAEPQPSPSAGGAIVSPSSPEEKAASTRVRPGHPSRRAGPAARPRRRRLRRRRRRRRDDRGTARPDRRVGQDMTPFASVFAPSGTSARRVPPGYRGQLPGVRARNMAALARMRPRDAG